LTWPGAASADTRSKPAGVVRGSGPGGWTGRRGKPYAVGLSRNDPKGAAWVLPRPAGTITFFGCSLTGGRLLVSCRGQGFVSA